MPQPQLNNANQYRMLYKKTVFYGGNENESAGVGSGAEVWAAGMDKRLPI